MRIKLSDHFDYKRLLRYSVSAICMMLFTSIYAIVDGFFVSNYCGKTPFAALNLIYPVIMLISTVGFMVGTGGSAVVARTLGEGDNKRAQRYFSMFVYAAIVLGITLTVLAQIFLPQISRLLGAEGKIFEDTLIYARVVLLSTPMLVLQVMFQTFFNTAEKPKLGFLITVISGGANIVLDFIFVGALGYGLAGAAWATVVSEYLGGAIPLIYFFMPNDSLLRMTKTTFEPRVFVHACWNGLSEFMGNVSASIVSILYNIQLLKYAGENGVSAFGVVMYVYLLFSAVMVGYGMATSPIIGFHYGARNMEEVSNVIRRNIVVMAVAGVLMFGAAELLSDAVARLFVSYDDDLMVMTRTAFRVTSITYLVYGYNVCGSSFFTALGNGTLSALIEASRLLIFQIIFLYTLPVIFGLSGIWYTLVASDVAAVGVTAAFLIIYRKKYGYHLLPE
ncbi:MAG: MATE family efflux transporter [Eubacterium sp.]|nr:MATE family efflux transporter [Eubacterium sp.]